MSNLEQLKEARKIIKESYDNQPVFEEENDFGKCGFIVSKIAQKSYLDDDGNVNEYSAKVYNIVLNDGSLVSEDWFDTYDFDCYNNYIIGFRRTTEELMALMQIPNYCSGPFLVKKYEYRYGAINSEGKLIVKPMYDYLTFNNEESFTAYHNGKLGYVSSINGEQITPIIFDHAQPFFEGLAAVEYQGKMGYVSRSKVMHNPKNKEQYAIAPSFDIAGDFENGFATVSMEGQKDFKIDKTGKVIDASVLKKVKK